MHTAVASGGVAQYEVNAFCLALLDEGLTLESLDEFQQSIHWPPKSNRGLKKDFFQQRIQKERTGHVKCFGGECISAVIALALFAERCLEPAGKLLQHARSMRLLNQIIDICHSGDEAVHNAPLLERLI